MYTSGGIYIFCYLLIGFIRVVDAFHFSRVGCGNTNDAKKDCSTGVDGKHCKKNGSVVQLKTDTSEGRR